MGSPRKSVFLTHDNPFCPAQAGFCGIAIEQQDQTDLVVGLGLVVYTVSGGDTLRRRLCVQHHYRLRGVHRCPVA